GCKESMVTAPLLLVMYDRTFVFDSWSEAVRARWKLYAALACTWVLAGLLMAGGPRSQSVGFSAGTSAWNSLLNQAQLIVHYLRLTIWPRSLVLDYGPAQPLTLYDVWPSALLVIGLVTATLMALATWPMLGFLGAWFFVTLAP